MNKKIILFLFLFTFLCIGCDYNKHSVYDMAREEGFIGSYEEWLELINGIAENTIVKVEINDNNEMIITMFNNETKNLGVVNIDEPVPDVPNEPTPEDKKSEKFKQPCESSCKIVRYFYTLDAEGEALEMSIIQFGSSFFTSCGVSYGKSDNTNFDVYAALSGKVINVEELTAEGLCVTIDHGDGVLTEYRGLSEARVSVDDEVTLGDVIGISGVTEYDAAANNHVHFRVSINGLYIDPLKVIGKSIEEVIRQLIEDPNNWSPPH